MFECRNRLGLHACMAYRSAIVAEQSNNFKRVQQILFYPITGMLMSYSCRESWEIHHEQIHEGEFSLLKTTLNE
jgi:hypothetical protein